MKRVLNLRPIAEADVATAHNYYTAHFPHKAGPFLETVDVALDNIQRQPQIYAVRANGSRRVNLRGFPYALVYLVVADEDELTGEVLERVVVLRCLHQSQDFTAALRPYQ